MRFLHTADWHVGKQLRGHSRSDEHEAVLAEILDIALRSRVDCVLVSGDLFDSHAPAPDAERLIYNFFAELVGHRLPAVVIAGNHDHPKRLGAIRHLMERLDLYIRPEPVAPDCGGLIEFTANGELARIAVLPFLPQRRVVDAAQLMLPEASWYVEYAEAVSQMCARLATAFSRESFNLLLGHLYIYGAQTSGSEREIHVALPYAIHSQRLPAGAHYIALGHLHQPQEIAAPSPTHYAGSPLQLDFGEQGQQKRVILVELSNPKRPVKIESILLASGKPLRDISATFEELEKRAAEWADGFLRVTVQVGAPVPGIADRVREVLPNVVDVRISYPRNDESSPEVRSLTKLAPEAIFTEYHKARQGVEPAPALVELFRELYEEACHEAD